MIPSPIGKALLCCGLIWTAERWGNFLEAQIAVGTWRSHYAYDTSYEVVPYKGSLYSHARHSLLRYDLKTGQISPFTAVQGLHTASITALVAVDNMLLVGYEDGRVELLREEQLFHLSQLQSSPLQLPKSIRTAFSSQEHVYVGGDFGLLVFDKKSLRLKDNYIELGKKANRIAVYEGWIQKDSIFLATAEGLIHAAATPEGELLDYRNWKRPLSGSGRKEQLISWQEQLYSLQKRNHDTQLLRYTAGYWQPQATFSGTYTFLRATHKGLLIGSDRSLLLYRTPTEFRAIAMPTATVQQLQSATYVEETLWISDAQQGMGRLEAEEVEWLRLSAPFSVLPHSLQAVGNRVYAFYRGAHFPDFRASEGGFSIFSDNRWQDPVLGTLATADVVHVLQPPGGALYVATYQHGIWQQVSTDFSPLPPPSDGALAAAAQQASTLAYDEAGGLLVATHNSPGYTLLRYHPSKGWSLVPALAALSGAFSVLLSQAEFGQIWGVLRHQGADQLLVFTSQGQNMRAASTNSTFSPQKIHALALDEAQRLWIGTSAGLYLLPQSSFAVFEAQTTLLPQPLRIQGRIVLDKEPVYDLWVDGAERLWCATATALWQINMEKDHIEKRFSSDNSPLPPAGNISLAMTQHGELFVGTSAGVLSYRSRSSIPQPNYQQVRVFPNPVRANFSGRVAISALPAQTYVRITTLSGQLLRALQVRGGTATWDTRNQHGVRVPAGIYIIHSVQKSGESHYAGKIAILR